MEIKELNLYDVMQNSALSAIALQSFILGYYKVAKNKTQKESFPKLTYMFYVLPIIYHKRSREIFRTSNQLYTAILNDNEIILGLQERSLKMAEQTFAALNLSFSKKILTYNSKFKTVELLIGYKSEKIKITDNILGNDVISVIQNSAYKLGAIFAKNTEKNLQLELNIRF